MLGTTRDEVAMTAPSATAGAPKRRRWGWWIFAGLLLALAALIVWFAFFWGVKRIAWREVIWFEDGTRVEIERRKTLVKVWHEWPVHAGLQTRRNAVTFPDGVRFDTEDRLSFVRLERGEGPVRWVLIASPLYCEEFNNYGRPKPDYIQFEYADGRWTYRPVEPRFFGKPANLLITDRGIPPSRLVTEAERQQWNSTAERIAYKYLVITVDERAWQQRDRGCNEGKIFN
jgi:hypothetical protein